MAQQNDWRWCLKCQGMFFSEGGGGACPAGGAHDPSQSGRYTILFGDGIPGAQDGWRWCSQCAGFFFGLNPDPGACPVGPGHKHDGSQSGHYALLFGDDVPGTQPGWRWCRKCQGLFFGQNPDLGACPAGDKHDPSQSGHYAVNFQPTLFYTLRWDQFQVLETRAGQNDTDVAAFSLKLGDRSFMLTKQMGDVDEGNYDVGFDFPTVGIDDPKTVFTLNHSIVNAGHNGGQVEMLLRQSLDEALKDLAKGSAFEGVPIDAAILAVNTVLAAAFAGCDGTVAADSLSVLRSDFDPLIPANGRVVTHTKDYPGSNSPDLCGDNSDYKVTLTLVRTQEGDVNHPDPNKAFIILSRSSGLVLDVPGASNVVGTPIQQYPDNGGENQHWQLIPVDGGFFQVRSRSSGLILDVEHSSGDDHARIIQWTDNGGHNQHWEFVPVDVPPPDLPFPVLGGGMTFYKLRCRLSGKVLDVPGRSADPGTQLQQYADNGANNQLWQLISVGDI
jgi:hypothetical protein